MNKDKYRILIGLEYEDIELIDSEYKLLMNYGHLKTEETFDITLKNGDIVNSSQIDDIKLIQS